MLHATRRVHRGGGDDPAAMHESMHATMRDAHALLKVIVCSSLRKAFVLFELVPIYIGGMLMSIIEFGKFQRNNNL